MHWSPRGPELAALATGGVALVGAVFLVDRLGALLVGGAAVLLVLLAARGALLRPRLSAGPRGLVVRTLLGRQELGWVGLQVRVRTTRRFGVRSRTLELDAPPGSGDDGVLVVLGRHDLGTDPEHVVRMLRALDPTRP